MFSLFLLASQALPSAQSPQDLVRVYPKNAQEFIALQVLASDLDDHYRPADGSVVVYATDQEQDAFLARGLEFEVQVENLSSFYANRAAQAGTRQSVGSMGGFRTLAELEMEMDRLATTYPYRVSPKFSIGQTLQGRNIWAFRMSTTPQQHDASKPTVWYDALHHAREPMSAESLLQFANLICETEGENSVMDRIVHTRNLLFVPCVNPDGYEINRQTNPNGGGMWRKNARSSGGGVHGVDLNRNYDWAWGPGWGGSSGSTGSETYRGTAAFSEPETAALRDLMALYPPKISITAHTYSNLWIFPWGYDTIFAPDDALLRHYASLWSADSGWEYGTGWETLYVANGVAGDYYYGAHGSFAYTPEIGNSQDGFWPNPNRIPELFASVLPGYTMAAQFSGASGQIMDAIWEEINGNGNEFPEPGETWELSLMIGNEGMEDLNGTLEIVSPNSFITVQGGSVNLQIPPGHEEFAPGVAVQFASNAPVGEALSLTALFDYENHADGTEVGLTLGRPRLLVFDNMEEGGAGWSILDDEQYSWEIAQPQQTQNNGQVVQPGEDNPDGDGTQCWVTGAAAGNSSGTNDVDGVTTLLSPIFDVASFDLVVLHYARWFANLPGNAMDDVFLAEISADAGNTWSVLEEIPNRNVWEDVGFELHEYASLTSTMQLRFTIADDPNNDLTEACLDDIRLEAWSDFPTLCAWGENEIGTSTRIFLDGMPNEHAIVLAAINDGFQFVPGIEGPFLLGHTWRIFFDTQLTADGRRTVEAVIPRMLLLSGLRVYLQAVMDHGGPHARFTNRIAIDVE